MSWLDSSERNRTPSIPTQLNLLLLSLLSHMSIQGTTMFPEFGGVTVSFWPKMQRDAPRISMPFGGTSVTRWHQVIYNSYIIWGSGILQEHFLFAMDLGKNRWNVETLTSKTMLLSLSLPRDVWCVITSPNVQGYLYSYRIPSRLILTLNDRKPMLRPR